VKKVLILVLLGLVMIPQLAKAEEVKPVQLAVYNPVQLVPEADSIKGVRLSLFYTVNEDVTGLFGWLGGTTTGDVKGAELGWDLTEGSFQVPYGWAVWRNFVVAGVRSCRRGFYLCSPAHSWRKEFHHGCQLGWVNHARADLSVSGRPG